MENVIKKLVNISESLDSKGLVSMADRVDSVASSILDVKTAQYVGVQGYAIRNSRCWGNCYRSKRSSTPSKSAQEIWHECHKEYVKSINNDGSKWDKYANDDSNLFKTAAIKQFNNELDIKIASKIEEKIASGFDVGSSAFASLEEIASESDERLIKASNDLLDIANELVLNQEISSQIVEASSDIVKEAGMFDFFKGVKNNIGNWASDTSFTGSLSNTVSSFKGQISQIENAINTLRQSRNDLILSRRSLVKSLNLLANDSSSTPKKKQYAQIAAKNLSELEGLRDPVQMVEKGKQVIQSLESLLRGNVSQEGQVQNPQQSNNKLDPQQQEQINKDLDKVPNNLLNDLYSYIKKSASSNDNNTKIANIGNAGSFMPLNNPKPSSSVESKPEKSVPNMQNLLKSLSPATVNYLKSLSQQEFAELISKRNASKQQQGATNPQANASQGLYVDPSAQANPQSVNKNDNTSNISMPGYNANQIKQRFIGDKPRTRLQ